MVPYLSGLGVTDCYASPYLKASPGSTHGYDICDHNQINPELGTEGEYAAFTAALRAHGMGQILDFVPNHMGVDAATNRWWRDVLENGRCSPFADFFDIDWEPIKPELKEKVLLPMLGAQYGMELERGALQLLFKNGSFTVRYFDHDLPVNPRQIPSILEHDLASLRVELGEEDPQFLEYLSIATALRNLPAETDTARDRIAERHREKELARERLQRLVGSSCPIREHIDNILRVYNGQVGKPESFDRLHALLEAQAYRVSYWRTASHEINYRRFFDINDLAGLRMEDSQVFANTHALLLRLIGAGHVTGLRLDHIDGLFDPQQYLEWLQQAIGHHLSIAADAARPDDAAAMPDATAGKPVRQSLYLAAEKILSAGESLSEHWPIAGTTGYDFLNDLNGLFVNHRNHGVLLRVYRRFTAVRIAPDDVTYASKKLIMDAPMASELNMLARALNRLSEDDRRTRDFTLNSLRDALQEVVACFPTYRTYVSARGWTDADRAAIETAIHRARRRNSAMEASIFDFVRDTLLPDLAQAGSADECQQRLTFAMKFQQYTGPVQAKGLEDTAFYRHMPLLSLNEVGGNPNRFGSTPAEFHAANVRRRQAWPFTMLASTTHDTKRGEDVRARLNVLSELPEEWGRHLSVWARINGLNRTVVDGEPTPDRNDEYLFYQTLLGVWPPGKTCLEKTDDPLVTRLQRYMLKAVREAKMHTSWIAENHAYEAALSRFVQRTLCGAAAPRFLSSFLPFQERIAQLGVTNALSQLVLKGVSPGVCDLYQGTELWDLSMVDPDNRRPVDYAMRQRLLTELQPFLSPPPNHAADQDSAVREMLVHWPDARIKLFVTAVLLRLRRRLASLFLAGTYEPLEARGERADHVVALARRHQHDAIVSVVPRLLAPLTTPAHPVPVGADSWGATRVLLPPELCANVLHNGITGEALQPEVVDGRGGLALATVLGICPVAVLVTTLRDSDSTEACGCS